MLELNNISTYYGAIGAVKELSLSVGNGEIVALIGANGAGKSTTLMTISSVLKPTVGSITFNGERIDNLKPHQVVKKGICHVPEGRRIFSALSVLENLNMGGYLHDDDDEKEKILKRVFEFFPKLKERVKQPGGTLSGGEQQMLAIGRALMGRPLMLLLDEPSLGLAPIFVQKIFEIIEEINRDGVTVLLVEQNATAALKLASRGYVLETGSIIAEDRADKLLGDPKIKKAYLGI